jgi:hypothetical protein
MALPLATGERDGLGLLFTAGFDVFRAMSIQILFKKARISVLM